MDCGHFYCLHGQPMSVVPPTPAAALKNGLTVWYLVNNVSIERISEGQVT